MQIIKSYDELLDYGVEKLISKEIIDTIKLDESFDLTIKIKGDSWDGLFDYRGAKYLLELQASINKLCKNVGNFQEDGLLADIKDSIIVKARIKDGCSFFEFKLSDTFTEILNGMNGTQKFIIASLIISTIAGYFTLDNVLKFKQDLEQNKHEIAKKQIDEDTKIELLKVIDKALDNTDDAEKPTRILVKTLSDEDTIKLSSKDETLSAEEAKELYPRKKRYKVTTDYIDDTFIVKDIRFDEQITITLEKGMFVFKAMTNLSNEEFTLLYQEIDQKQQEGELPFEIDLQITAHYTPREIKKATIVGLGQKRQRAKNIKDLLTEYK